MKIFRSMRYTITFIVGIMILIICASVIRYRFYVLEQTERQMVGSMEATLNLYLGELDSYMETAENYLLSKSLMDEQRMRLKDPKSELEHYLAEITITDELSGTITDLKYLDGIFIYDPSQDVFLHGEQGYVSSKEIVAIRSSSGYIMEEFTEGYGKWYFVPVEGGCYYFRTFVNNQLYTCGWINVSDILKELEELCMELEEYIVICDDQNQVVAGNYPGEMPKSLEDLKKNRSGYKTIKGKSIYGFSVILYKKAENLTGVKTSIGLDITVSMLLILVLIMFLLVILNKSFMKPLERVIMAMERLQKGDFEVKLAGNNGFEEFEMINATFDAMAEQIEKLKIDVYEEKLQQQTAKLQYLQLQINPHFLTNCLSLIRNLSIMDQEERIEEAIFLLSKYIRYTMNSKTTVSLEQELGLVRDYIDLQKMRYEELLRLELDVDKEHLKETIPSMMIQTFVDNAVKHQMTPDEMLCITVKICRVELSYGVPSLYILIKDTGDGFEEGILEKIRSGQVVVKNDGEHIGIYNVVQRLEILYGKKAGIFYDNQKEGGAMIQIYIPMEVRG